VAATSFDKIIKAAREAYQKGNPNYSLELFQQALALDLDAVEARNRHRPPCSRWPSRSARPW
jgi:hypothetical protein